MTLANLSTGQLRSVLALCEKRDRLLQELANVERALASSTKDGAVSLKALRQKAGIAASSTTRLGKKRGAVKEAILGLLEKAGSEGVSVRDMSKKLGLKNQNLHVWFNTTGRKVKGLKKVGKGLWTYNP